jgi:catechol 2,3-dioxygenase-like lactoylglutathione lyase family enzyme
MSLALNYVSFVVADMQRSLDFYRTLGLPIPEGAHLNAAGEPEDHVEIDQHGLRVAWETETMIQGLGTGWTAPPHGQSRIGVAFGADMPAEVDAACERLRKQGYTIKAEPFDAFWGQRYASVTDPDGNSVDIFAWLIK